MDFAVHCMNVHECVAYIDIYGCSAQFRLLWWRAFKDSFTLLRQPSLQLLSKRVIANSLLIGISGTLSKWLDRLKQRENMVLTVISHVLLLLLFLLILFIQLFRVFHPNRWLSIEFQWWSCWMIMAACVFLSAHVSTRKLIRKRVLSLCQEKYYCTFCTVEAWLIAVECERRAHRKEKRNFRNIELSEEIFLWMEWKKWKTDTSVEGVKEAWEGKREEIGLKGFLHRICHHATT